MTERNILNINIFSPTIFTLGGKFIILRLKFWLNLLYTKPIFRSIIVIWFWSLTLFFLNYRIIKTCYEGFVQQVKLRIVNSILTKNIY